MIALGPPEPQIQVFIVVHCLHGDRDTAAFARNRLGFENLSTDNLVSDDCGLLVVAVSAAVTRFKGTHPAMISAVEHPLHRCLTRIKHGHFPVGYLVPVDAEALCLLRAAWRLRSFGILKSCTGGEQRLEFLNPALVLGRCVLYGLLGPFLLSRFLLFLLCPGFLFGQLLRSFCLGHTFDEPCRHHTHKIRVGTLQFLSLFLAQQLVDGLVRNTLVAVDAGISAFHGVSVLLAGPGPLICGVHGLETVAVPAFA